MKRQSHRVVLLIVLSKFSTNQKHYPDPGSGASSVLRLFLSRHFVGKPVVASSKVVCFVRPLYHWSVISKRSERCARDKSPTKSANKNIVWQPSLPLHFLTMVKYTAKIGFHKIKKRKEAKTWTRNLPTDWRKDKRGKMLNKLVLEI